VNKSLDVHTAELITAAVEVKTLTIRGKQVTLAVFRQLEEKPLLLDDGSLAGIPWGRVNYHPDKCADTGAHMHVVWQEGTELRRARVAMTPRFGTFWAEGDLNDFVTIGSVSCLLSDKKDRFWTWLTAEVEKCSGRYSEAAFTLSEFPTIQIGAESDLEPGEIPHLPGTRDYQSPAERLSHLLTADPDEDEVSRKDASEAYGWYQSGGPYASPPLNPLSERIEAARRDCVTAVEKAHEAALAVHEWLFCSNRPSLADARAELLAEVAAEHARRERVRSATTMLAELSQLFIAV
jgi:hypothetical protein